MPNSLYSERTLDEGMAVFMELCALLDPKRPETSRLVAHVQQLLGRLNRQIVIDRSVGYMQRAGEPPMMSQRLRQDWTQVMQAGAARGAPPNGKDNAPTDWNSAEAWAELTA